MNRINFGKMEKKHINISELNDLISDYRSLFWYTPGKSMKDISLEQVVETILNYGDEKAIKQLFDLVGVDHVATIFRNQITRSERSRNNYQELVANFFNLYFSRHAKGYSLK